MLPLFESRCIAISTDLDQDECRRRLISAGLNYVGVWRGRDHPVRGSLFGSNVRLQQNLSGFSSFQITLRGTLKSSAGGTQFIGRFTNPFMFWLIPLTLAVLAVASKIDGSLGTEGITKGLPEASHFVVIACAYLFLWLVSAMVTGGRKHEESLLTNFLSRTIDGRIVPDSGMKVSK